MNITRLNEQVAQVTAWNQVAQNMVEDFSKEKAIAQASYVFEEAKETIDAILTNNNQEHLDGVADIFVTLTYLIRVLSNEDVVFEPQDFLGYGEPVEGFDLRYGNLGIAASIMGIVDMVHRDTYNELDTNSILFALKELMAEMFNNVNLCYNIDVTDVIQKVLDSNWSKYLPATTEPGKVLEEVRWINENGFMDIAPVYSGDYIVFRDKHGKGKIRKPSTYAAPGSFF
jgi:hypothetical protein